MTLRMLVLDHGLNRSYAVRFKAGWTVLEILDWTKAVTKTLGIGRQTSRAIYDDAYPPVRPGEAWRLGSY